MNKNDRDALVEYIADTRANLVALDILVQSEENPELGVAQTLLVAIQKETDWLVAEVSVNVQYHRRMNNGEAQ